MTRSLGRPVQVLDGDPPHRAARCAYVDEHLVVLVVSILALKVVGAGYLFWLAVDAVRRGSSLTLNAERAPVRPFAANFLTGAGVNLLNPKVILFFMTFLPQFVAAGDPHATGKFFFLGFFYVAVSIPIVSPMILAADRFSSALRGNPAISRITDWLLAGVFGAFAVKILITQVR